jgi:hypothetical protein
VDQVGRDVGRHLWRWRRVVGDDQGRSWAEDGELATEIELYGDLVVAASESESELTLPQIDRVLRVDGAEGAEESGGDAGTEDAPTSDGETIHVDQAQPTHASG